MRKNLLYARGEKVMLLYPKAFSKTLGRSITASEAQKRGLKGELVDPHDFRCDGAEGTCDFPLTCVNMLRKGLMSPHFRPSSHTASHAKGCKYASESKPVPPREPSEEAATPRPFHNETIDALKLPGKEPTPTRTDSDLPSQGKRRDTSSSGGASKRNSKSTKTIEFVRLVDKYCALSSDERKMRKLKVDETIYSYDEFFRSVSGPINDDKGLHTYFGAGTIKHAKDSDKWYIKFHDAPSVLCVIQPPPSMKTMFTPKDRERFAEYEKRTDLTFFVLGEIHTRNGTSYINSTGKCGVCFPAHIKAVAFQTV